MKNETLFPKTQNRQTRLHALYELERGLTSTMDLQGRLKILLEHTLSQLHADIGVVFLIEQASNDLVIISQRGARHFEFGYGFRLKVGEGAAGWIAQNSQPLAIQDVHENAQWLRADGAKTEGIVSYLGVPLIVDGQTIGVLDVATRVRRAFGEEDIKFFKTLAGRAAVSIKNAQMIEELRLYKNAFNSTADAITITDLNGRILDANPAFERLTGYTRAEAVGQNMRIVKSSRSTPGFYQGMWEQILADGYWIGEIINRRKNGGEWVSWNSISAVRDEQNHPIAYVGVNRDITDLKRVEAALRRRANELEFLHRAALVMTAMSDLDAALDQVLALMSQEFHYPHLAIGLLDRDSQRIRLRAQRGIRSNQWGPDGPSLLMGQGLVGWVILHGKPLLVNDVSLDARYVAGISGTCSELVVPLRIGERTIGVINVESPELNAYGPEDLRLLSTLAGQIATAIENARLFDAERTRRAELSALYDLSRALADATNDVNAILEIVVRHVVETIHVTFARVGLVRNKDCILRNAHPARVRGEELGVDIYDSLDAMPNCLKAAQQEFPVIFHRDDPALTQTELERLFPCLTRTLCLVPLRLGDRILGLLMLGEVRNEEREPFTPEKIHLARSIGDQAASTLNRAELFIELEESYLQTVFALANAVDAKDTYTANHAQQLTAMALAVGREMGLSPREMEDLRYGAILHDIGKIGIPDAILQKPASLDEEEWKWMRQHPEIGARILAPIPRLSGASRIVRHHHERFDGTGYPDRLSGDTIPLVARILTVVDAYNAILDAREYKPARSQAEAIAELKQRAVAPFDPCIVNVFLQVLKDNHI